jgi:O-antigen/teichoic acid export membrane protein
MRPFGRFELAERSPRATSDPGPSKAARWQAQDHSVDNGPESAGRLLDHWAYLNGVELDFSRPGTPTDNAYIEALNARIRAECLNASWFLSLADARERIEAWRIDYNTAFDEKMVQNLDDVERTEVGSRNCCEALSRTPVDHRQQAERATVEQRVGHEVHRPHVIRRNNLRPASSMSNPRNSRQSETACQLVGYKHHAHWSSKAVEEPVAQRAKYADTRTYPHQPQQMQPARHGGALYFSASLTSQASAMLRYLIIARLLGPEQLGLASALTVTVAFFQMISDTGSDRFLIQDHHGDSSEVQGLVQLLDLGRGILVAAGLVILAAPIAFFCNSPRLREGLVLLAVSPLIFGLLHLDIRRVQRGHDFRPAAICQIAAEIGGVAGVSIAAWLTRDFKAVAYGVICRTIIMVIGSHILARRPYRLRWDQIHVSRFTRFAMPLMFNGLLLFIFSQGDRVIVGGHLGMTTLGYYSTIILLIYIPASTVATYMHAIYVPMIAAQRQSPKDQERLSNRLGGETLALALAMVVGFAVVAPRMIPILFGNQYAQPALLVSLVGMLGTTRFFLSWPTTTMLALGRSTPVLISNLAHVLIFPSSLIGLWLMGGIDGVVVGFLGAEMIAACVALILLNRTMLRPPFQGFGRLAALTLTYIALVGWDISLSAAWPAKTCMIVATICFAVWLCRSEAAIISRLLALLSARLLPERIALRLNFFNR